MAETYCLLHRRGPVVELELHNPPLNVLNQATLEAIYRSCDSLRHETDVRVVILRGHGERAFSAGSDIKEFPLEQGVIGGREKITREHHVLQAISTLPQVTIAAIHGYCLGGGLALALATDLRVASADATLGFPEINVGGIAAGAIQRVVRLVGEARALELLMLGEQVSASTAAEMGLVHRVVPREELWHRAGTLSDHLLRKPWRALQAIKTSLSDPAMVVGVQRETEAFAQLFEGHDIREGVKAFLEKREPRWQHK